MSISCGGPPIERLISYVFLPLLVINFDVQLLRQQNDYKNSGFTVICTLTGYPYYLTLFSIAFPYIRGHPHLHVNYHSNMIQPESIFGVLVLS